MDRSTFGSIKHTLFGGSKKSKEDKAREAQASQDQNTFRRRLTPTRRPDPPTMASQPNTHDAPPPVYTAAPQTQPPARTPITNSTPTTTSSTTTDDRFAFLATFDTIFLIDDSGSMAGSRWLSVSRALAAITPICTLHDRNGVDIKFINTPEMPSHSNVTLPSTVHEIFQEVRPSGSTNTGTRINRILKPYLQRLEASPRNSPPKPINIIVLTDGEPSDDVESPIIQAATKLDRLEAEPWQVGIQFFQVGGDQRAKKHLEELDDCLSEQGKGCRDIVDTVPFVGQQGEGALDGEAILKVVLGAVNKRLDRKKIVVV